MADATLTTVVPDSVTAIDVHTLAIHPLPENQTVFYRLRLTWSSGNVTFRENTIPAADFISNLTAWVQATPRKKFLNWLVLNGYETNLTVL